jgi:hypothetical protein
MVINTEFRFNPLNALDSVFPNGNSFFGKSALKPIWRPYV